MRKKTLLAVWTAGILFPMAWFSQQTPGYDQWFNRIFAPQWMHILMHALLYGVLAAGISLIWPKQSFWPVLAAVLLVGVGQEVLQSLPRGQFFNSGALFDLGIDLAGSAAGFLAAKTYCAIPSTRKSAIERNV